MLSIWKKLKRLPKSCFTFFIFYLETCSPNEMFKLTLWQIWDFNVNTCITSRLKQPQQKLTYLCTLKILLFFQNLVCLLYGFPVVSIVQAICTPSLWIYSVSLLCVYIFFLPYCISIYLQIYITILRAIATTFQQSICSLHVIKSENALKKKQTKTLSLWNCYNRSNHSAHYNSLYASIIPKWSITQVLDS